MFVEFNKVGYNNEDPKEATIWINPATVAMLRRGRPLPNDEPTTQVIFTNGNAILLEGSASDIVEELNDALDQVLVPVPDEADTDLTDE